MKHTIENLKAALAGESQAHIKYRYFAKIARQLGDEETAKLFEHTADQEVLHAWGHLDVLFKGKDLKVEDLLAMAIEGETYEYQIMYPKMASEAISEQEKHWALEHAEESHEHAEIFKSQLELAKKRFKALQGVEQRHANRYQEQLDKVKGEAK